MVRRNPARAKEMEKSRDEKLDRINIELIRQNTYLQGVQSKVSFLTVRVI